jgi:hypothetical protein
LWRITTAPPFGTSTARLSPPSRPAMTLFSMIVRCARLFTPCPAPVVAGRVAEVVEI